MAAYKKHYLEGDNNGGYRVSKTIALPTLIAVIITIVTLSAGLVSAWSSMNNSVDELSDYMQEAGPRHTAIISDIDVKIVNNEKSIAITSVKIDQISRDITEIKESLKEMRKELISHDTK